MAELHHKSIESSAECYFKATSNSGYFGHEFRLSAGQSYVVQVHHVQPNDAGRWSLTDMRPHL